jgi:hypothetical protein
LCDRFGNLIDPIAAGCAPPVFTVEWWGEEGVSEIRSSISPIAVVADEGGADVSPVMSVDGDGDGDTSVKWTSTIPLEVSTISLWTADMKPIWVDGIYTNDSTKPARGGGGRGRRATRLAANAADQEPGAEAAQSKTPKYPQLQCYVVSDSSISFQGRIESIPGISVKLSLCDAVPTAAQTFTPCVVDSYLVAGLPTRLLIRCPDLNVTDFREEVVAPVTSNRELESFEAKFIDDFGNDATVHTIKTCKVLLDSFFFFPLCCSIVV